MKKGRDLEKLFEEYIKVCRFSKRLSDATIKSYRESFKHLERLVPEIKKTDDLSYERLLEFFERLQTRKRIVGKGKEKTGVKNSTVKTYHSKLNSFFGWLIICGYIEENPLDKIDPPNPKYTDIRAMKSDDVNKIMGAVSLNSKNIFLKKRDTAIISTFLLTGIRLGELEGLRVIDIDLDRRFLNVNYETSKSKINRQIPLNPMAVTHLEDYIQERKKRGYKSERFFVSNNRDSGITKAGIKHLVKRIKDKSCVNFHVHKFRHTFACNLAKNNSNFVKVQKLLGHSDPRMTQTYLRSISYEDMRGDINKLRLDNF